MCHGAFRRHDDARCDEASRLRARVRRAGRDGGRAGDPAAHDHEQRERRGGVAPRHAAAEHGIAPGLVAARGGARAEAGSVGDADARRLSPGHARANARHARPRRRWPARDGSTDRQHAGHANAAGAPAARRQAHADLHVVGSAHPRARTDHEGRCRPSLRTEDRAGAAVDRRVCDQRRAAAPRDLVAGDGRVDARSRRAGGRRALPHAAR